MDNFQSKKKVQLGKESETYEGVNRDDHLIKIRVRPLPEDIKNALRHGNRVSDSQDPIDMETVIQIFSAEEIIIGNISKLECHRDIIFLGLELVIHNPH